MNKAAQFSGHGEKTGFIIALAISTVAHLCAFFLLGGKVFIKVSPMPPGSLAVDIVSFSCSEAGQSSARQKKPDVAFHKTAVENKSTPEDLKPVDSADSESEPDVGTPEQKENTSGQKPSTVKGVEAIRQTGEAKVRQQQMFFKSYVDGQMRLMKSRHYSRAAKSAVHILLEETIDAETRSSLDGKVATIEIHYSEKGDLSEMKISTESKDLMDILRERVNWKSVPSPSTYLLPCKNLLVRIIIKDGSMGVIVSPS